VYWEGFLHPVPNLSACPSSPGAREPISVVVPFDLLGKREAMMQKVNFGHGKTNMDQDGEKERVTLHSSFKIVV
jgi:hypothetical protein